MDKAIAERWTAALRSGEYPQTHGALCNAKGFCCLGVLCDLYAEGHDADWEGVHNWHGEQSFKGNTTVPPPEVLAWAGMKHENGGIESLKPVRTCEDHPIWDTRSCLAGLNDDGKSFLEIADIIETYVDEL